MSTIERYTTYTIEHTEAPMDTGDPLVPKRDLSDIIGSLSDSEAKEIEIEVCLQNAIDVDMWK